MREIVLDTETTGLAPETGDRLVEIGAVELKGHMPTGNTYHQYLNPERDVPEDAVQVTERLPDPDRESNPDRKAAMLAAFDYMDLKPGMPVTDIDVDKVFIGACTNARIEDLRFWRTASGLSAISTTSSACSTSIPRPPKRASNGSRRARSPTSTTPTPSAAA